MYSSLLSIEFMMWDDKVKILIISYNNHFLSESTLELEKHFDIQRANSEQVAFFLIREADVKLVLLDVESPLSGSVHSLRKSFGYNIGVIGVGSDTRSNIEATFRSNSDIFVGRSAHPQQLILSCFALKKRLERTNQVEQRANPNRSDSRARIKLGEIEVFPKDYLVHYQGQAIRTTPTQFKLLLSFISKTDELLSREWLQEHIWEDSNISHRSIDAHISKLKKLIPSLSSSLINIYGKGYMLNSSNLKEDIKAA
ncbi:MAG: response regulator transcription factor [Bdellovibrionales bacterium]